MPTAPKDISDDMPSLVASDPEQTVRNAIATPVPSPEAELLLLEGIEQAAQRLRQTLACQPAAAHELTTIIGKVNERPHALARIFRVDDEQHETRLRQWLKGCHARLLELVDENRRQYLETLEPHVDGARGAELREAVLEREARCHQLLESLPLGRQALGLLFNRLAAFNNQYTEARDRYLEQVRKGTEDGGEAASECHRLAGIACREPEEVDVAFQEARVAFGDLEDAKHALASKFMRLVVSLASKYGGRGLSTRQLLEAGSTGLVSAAGLYEHREGSPFHTGFQSSATLVAQQAITQAIANRAKSIQLSASTIVMMSCLRRLQNYMRQQLSRTPNVEELVEATGLSPSLLRRLSALSKLPVSPAGGMGHMPDEPRDALRCALRSAIGELEDHQEVVLLSCGLGADGARTPEEIAEALDVPLEDVQGIEASALSKLVPVVPHLSAEN